MDFLIKDQLFLSDLTFEQWNNVYFFYPVCADQCRELEIYFFQPEPADWDALNVLADLFWWTYEEGDIERELIFEHVRDYHPWFLGALGIPF